MLVPSHRYTHEAVWISPADSAWDSAKISAENDAIHNGTSEYATMSAHPMTRYWVGESRYDIATVKQYLLPDASPTMFRLRRLSLSQWMAIQQLDERGLNVQARIDRIRFGLAGIDNIEGVTLTGGALTDDEIDTLRCLLGDKLLTMLSNAVFLYNRELGSSELFR